MPPKGRCRGSPSAAKSGDAVTDERVVVFTPDKDGYTHTSRGRVPVLAARRGTVSWVVDGPPGATGVLSGRGGRKRGPLTRSNFEVMHLMQGCHCALLQKLCKMPKSQILNP